MRKLVVGVLQRFGETAVKVGVIELAQALLSVLGSFHDDPTATFVRGADD
jgi:hypothetical protein